MATPVTVSATRIALSCLIPAMATLAGALPQGASAGATVAGAALAENEGRYAEAEQLLRRVVASGDHAAAARARTRLDALLQRQGKAAEIVAAAAPTGDSAAPTTQGPPADPITRLIQKLDTGTKANVEVKQAISQLDDLGSLIVPHLLGALPQFGPFGVHNALQLLRYERDDRIATTLGAMLDQGKPEVVAAITGQLGRMHAAVALPLAQKIAGLDLDSGALGAALSVLIEQGGHDELARKLAQRMLDSGDEAMQRALLAAMSDGDRDWFGALYDALRACDGADVRASATFQHIEAAGLDEDAALAAIAGLESRDIAWRISALGERHPDWARVGAIGLRVTPTDDKWDSTRRNIIEKFEWWRAPEQAMPELLKLPLTSPMQNNFGTNSPEWAAYQAVGKFLSRASGSDWQLPEVWDEPVAERVTRLNGDWRAFVGLLPEDAEQRALRIWRAAPAARVAFATAAIGVGRPWHDLASEVLLEFGPSHGSTVLFLRGDWTGASETAVARLRTFVELTAKLPSNAPANTASEIVRLYADTPSLPDDLVMPLVGIGHNAAWDAVCRRAPRAVLTYARDGKLYAHYFQTIRSLLLSHGTTEDLPVALRVVRESYVPNQDQAGMRQWFGTQAPGHLDIVRLDSPEVLLRTPSQDLAHTLAGEAATRIRAQDIEAALKLLPVVSESTRGRLLEGIARVVDGQHVGALRDALRTDLQGEPLTTKDGNGRSLLMPRLVQLLASTGGRSALPELRAVLEREDLADDVILAAARGIVATAGDSRAREFAAMLDSERAVIVQAALYSFGEPEAGDAAMVDRAIAAIRRHGAELQTTGALFVAMKREECVRVAKAILESKGMREFGRRVVTEAIDQLADNRDPAHVPAFALAASHRETNVRLEASKQLGNSFDRSAVPHLLELLRDESSKVRQAAQSGLDQIANYLDQLKMWQDRFGDLPATGKGK